MKAALSASRAVAALAPSHSELAYYLEMDVFIRRVNCSATQLITDSAQESR
ncbi:hypothetical protein H634G_11279 [Metarhizium anisopliae BRIP 53293]|uniref:Uncharacterized protein n=1 Tax=Metarhizium anisopliae BRIP 53293 TaxID=1291518 RepID=A0A0D9NHI3_METAN|nr:hypothetical protein H634G_11279 [Metarhizium anisopliae BRIP 53293]KJK84728.1 hypothetical protein H633G_11514 [Metarhizium anisopliae BRIP 53284]